MAVEKYSKEELLQSKRFADNYDILNAVLDGGRKYTIVQAEEAIGKFKKGKVM